MILKNIATPQSIDDAVCRLGCCISNLEVVRYSVDGPENVTAQFLDALSSVLFQLESVYAEMLNEK